MHVEITRLITGWLEHKEFGVGVLLPNVPRQKLKGGTDTAPEKPAVFNDVDFDITKVAGIDPPIVPALVVISDIDLRGGNVAQPKSPSIEYAAVVGIGYYAEEVEKPRNLRDGNYVLRAVLRSLRLYQESPERSKDYRELNAIRITTMTGLTIQRVAGAVPKSRLFGIVFADFKIMDKAP